MINSDAALSLETNQYLDGLFDGAEAQQAALEERARDALDDEHRLSWSPPI